MAFKYVDDVATPREAAAGILAALRDGFREMAIKADRPSDVSAMESAAAACDEAMRRVGVR